MDYKGKYKIFDSTRIGTYPLSGRKNRVTRKDLIQPLEIIDEQDNVSREVLELIELIARNIISCRSSGKPVILFTGAHLVKNGLSLLLIDLIKKGMVALIAGNCATAIHDFELALIGQTSEDVPDALEKGRFGMAFEFSYFNKAISKGNILELGLGESLGRLMNDTDFKKAVIGNPENTGYKNDFLYPEISVASNCYLANVPFTIHATMGTDVIDQHPTFDGGAKGACSGRDFLIFVEEVSKLSQGGVYLNIGSAVSGPEVLLKAVSMCSNTGNGPDGVIFADFDMRPEQTAVNLDEKSFYYYFRDQKSITRRIPEAFNSRGCYIQGNIKDTFKALYRKINALSG